MEKFKKTRMHSSRMCNSRSSTVCGSLLPGRGGGVSAWSGRCLPGLGWVCPVWGMSAWSGGCLPGPGGVSLVQGGVSLVQGMGACPETPPVNRITHTCKNITLATTSLQPVKISARSLKLNYWSPRHQTAVFKALISFKCS